MHPTNLAGIYSAIAFQVYKAKRDKKTSTLTVDAKVAAGGLLVLAPDPVVRPIEVHSMVHPHTLAY